MIYQVSYSTTTCCSQVYLNKLNFLWANLCKYVLRGRSGILSTFCVLALFALLVLSLPRIRCTTTTTPGPIIQKLSQPPQALPQKITAEPSPQEEKLPAPSSDLNEVQSDSTGQAPCKLKWIDFVKSERLSQDCEVMDDDESMDEHRYQIEKHFGLEPVRQTPVLLQQSSDTLIFLCTTGVYGFGIDFDFGFLIADTVEAAEEFIMVPGTIQQGPTTRGHGFYDITAQDIFGNEFGKCLSDLDDQNSDIAYYDSGIEDCSDNEELQPGRP